MRRTKRSLIRFRARVITNSSRPTKKRLRVGDPAAGLVGADRQGGHRRGHRLAGQARIEVEHRAADAAGGEGDDHRLADRAREADDQRRDDARHGRRDDDAQARDALARAEAVRRLAQRVGHGVHRVLGDRRDERRDQDADGNAGAGHVEERRRSRADDGRSTRGVSTVSVKKPSTTLGIAARTSRIGLTVRAHAGPGVLGQEDRRAESERRGDEHRDAGDDERAGDDREQVVVAGPRLPRAADQAARIDLVMNTTAWPMSVRTISIEISTAVAAATKKSRPDDQLTPAPAGCCRAGRSTVSGAACWEAVTCPLECWRSGHGKLSTHAGRRWPACVLGGGVSVGA